MFSLSGKTALVTGGASGIGAAIVRRFVAAGARVYSVDRHPHAPDGATPLVADVAEEAQLLGALEAARRDAPLDIIVNNAAIQPLGLSFADVTEALLARTFAVNVNAIAYALKHAPPRMHERGGRILNTSSFVASIGVPGGTAYAASKAAVSQLTRCAAVELAPRRITVNAVAPGTVRTPAVVGVPGNPEIPFVERRTPLGRLAHADEIAAAFHFLASDEAAYITGVVLPVDGGIAAGWEAYDLPPFDPNIVQ